MIMTTTSNLCKLSIARLSNYLASDYFPFFPFTFPLPFYSPVLCLQHLFLFPCCQFVTLLKAPILLIQTLDPILADHYQCNKSW